MLRVRPVLVLLALLTFLLATAGGLQSSPGKGNGQAQPPGQAFVPDEILIKFQPNARAEDRANARANLGASRLHTFKSGAEHWRLGRGVGVERAIARIKGNPHVAYAEPNYIITADLIPDDPRFPEMYGLNNTGQTGGTADADIDAPEAWGVSQGSRDVLVGVIDTGADYNHPDLAANIWTNPGEIPGNSIDDDANGCVDDIHGCDFYNNDGDPFDGHGHGTHTAGTIGAVGNNGIGVTGVNWRVTIMPIKFLSDAGSGSTSGAILSVEYATRMGVDLTSNSWGGGGYSQALYDAIADAGAHEIAFIAAAGNDGVDTDASPHYPSSYDLANIISVAATDHNDAMAYFSNYGLTSVDIGAPGVDVLSTLPGNSYGTNSGTSMATPHVSGVAALIRAVNPDVPVAQMKSIILNSGDPKPSMAGKTVSGRRLNVFFAIAEPDTVPPAVIADLATENPMSNTIGLSWTATGDDGTVGTAAYYEVRYSASPINEANFAAATRAGNEPTPALAGTHQTMEVRGLVASTAYYFAMKAFDEWGNQSPISNLAMGTTLPPPMARVAPTGVTDTLFTGQMSDHTVILSNIGPGTLDFTIPTPMVGGPAAIPQEPLILGKDDPDPRSGEPVTLGAGGPDAYGYRWRDSDEAVGGPTYAWEEISGSGTAVAVTSDDSTSTPIPLGFDFPFYGTFFNSIRVCSNGWLSFTNSASAYSNQPLPNSGAPENLLAPFWDDLNPGGATHVYFQSFGNRAVVEWTGMPPYTGSGTFTFQAILEDTGAITYQYKSMTGSVESATVGIQNADKTVGLQVAFNQAYLHDELAVRIAAIPQWLTAAPTAGRILAGQSLPLNVHLDAAGLEGGTYPGQVNILTNDPDHPTLTVDVSLHVDGAPDVAVQPASLAYGDSYLGLPKNLALTVANIGTDILNVTNILPSAPELSASPSAFTVPPHSSQNVTVTWIPSVLGPFTGSVTVQSDAAGNPSLVVPVTGNAIPAPVAVVDPTSFEETLFSGAMVTRTLTVTNGGGSPLIIRAAADQGPGSNGLVVADETGLGTGGPDASGMRWWDSDFSGGPIFGWTDISTTGTPIAISGDDTMSSAISMGMTFPFYGTNYTSLKVCTNGYISFDPSATCSYSNTVLPSTSAAKSMIAMFWDDLNFYGVQRARYLYDGTRFMVQFTDVPRYGQQTTSHLTFQVQLYPSGKILIQYLTMIIPASPYLTSATIGVQNDTRTIGLQVVKDAAYVKNNLAIQFGRYLDWLTVTPAGPTTVMPGASQPFSVRFNATGRPGGTLTGNVVLGTNIPSQPQILVPSILHVIGRPQVGLVPTSKNFGTVFAGYPQLTTFLVVNTGTDVLNISDITTTDPSLTAEESPGPGDEQIEAAFPLPPGGSRVFSLRWYPAAPGTLNAEVLVHSDDPVTPIAHMPVTGIAIPPPVAVHSPASYTEAMNAGEVLTRTLHLENQGGSNLNFSTALRSLSGTPVPVYEDLELKKDEEDPRPGILGGGGPDLFGYRWKDSDAVGGPTFSWVDITGIGTPITTLTSDDQNSGAIPIGFSFPFYGNTFSSVNVVTNGWLSFTNTTTSLSNQPLPNTGAPENLLAPFWDDLHFRGAVHAYTYNDGSRFIVQYNDVDRYSTYELPSPAHLTFQVILYPNGRIAYQYLTMYGYLTSATIGIQNQSKNDGLMVVYSAAYMHDNLAVEFRPPMDFLSISPTDGTIPPGGFGDLEVRIDATNLIGGDYAAAIDLTTNDPARGLITVPLNLHVTGIPDIDAVPPALTFPTTFVGFSASRPLSLRNVGTDVLHVTGATISGDFAFTGLTPPISLAPAAAVPVTVQFVPTAAGLRTGVLTIQSDDPDEPELMVLLQGQALIAPVIGVDPSSIHTALPPGGTRTKTLTVHNTGGSDLVWSLGTNIISRVVTPYPAMELAKDEPDPRVGILGSGGPDMFGYKWRDSDEAGGPVFSFADIRTTGTPITFGGPDDYFSGPFSLGMSFPFYGNTFSQFWVSTNGWVSFSAPSSSDLTNDPLPNTGAPMNLLALFWDDLHLRTGDVRYLYDGSRLILQYTGVDKYSPSGGSLTFQVILYPSGKIVYQYLTMTSTALDSATIGIQNADGTDGLQVVYALPYVHDNLAIEIKPIPDWLTASPAGGTIPAGGSQLVTLTLKAAGLDDGLHEATLDFTSNDPYHPLVQVPVELMVGLTPTAYLNFDPDALNLSSMGQTVKMVIELPPEYDPHNVNVASIRLNDTVPALPHPVAYTDENHNGILELMVKFDRAAVEAVLSPGTSVPITVQGEVTDVTWFRGTTTARVIRPQVTHPNGAEYFVGGQAVAITWEPAAWAGSVLYDVYLSRDGGNTWEVLAENLDVTSYAWVVGADLTLQGRVRVFAKDNQGVMGYDTSNADFTIAGSLMPPHGIGNTLGLTLDGTHVNLSWKRPAADPTHGPVERYRVQRSLSVQGPFEEIGTVTTEGFQDPRAGTDGATVVFYRIVANNGAGDSTE